MQKDIKIDYQLYLQLVQDSLTGEMSSVSRIGLLLRFRTELKRDYWRQLHCKDGGDIERTVKTLEAVDGVLRNDLFYYGCRERDWEEGDG